MVLVKRTVQFSDQHHPVCAAEVASRHSYFAIFLADLKNGTARPIHRASPEAQLAFPGFMNPDRIVVYNETAQKLIVLERTRRILD